MRFVPVIILCVLMGTSCATSGFRGQAEPAGARSADSSQSSPVADYFRARLADAGDIFSFSIASNVYGAKATVSRLGVGLYSTGASILSANEFVELVNCGHPRLLNRGGYGKPACRSGEAGLRNGVLGVHRIQDHTILIHFAGASRAAGLGLRRAESTNKVDAKLRSPLESRNPEEWTRLSVSAGFILGVHVGFNPGALVDFVLGWFGVDIMDDDG